MNCEIGLKLRLKWNPALPSVERLWSCDVQLVYVTNVTDGWRTWLNCISRDWAVYHVTVEYYKRHGVRRTIGQCVTLVGDGSGGHGQCLWFMSFVNISLVYNYKFMLDKRLISSSTVRPSHKCMANDLHVSRLTFIVDRHTTIKLYSNEISRLHHSLEWNILVTLVYSTPDYGVTYTKY